MPMTDEVMNWLKNEVKKECGIIINPVFFDCEDDNQTCFFEVDEKQEFIVVNTIHSFGDFACAFDVPKFENGKWVNFYE